MASNLHIVAVAFCLKDRRSVPAHESGIQLPNYGFSRGTSFNPAPRVVPLRNPLKDSLTRLLLWASITYYASTTTFLIPMIINKRALNDFHSATLIKTE
jgi:hypothetical protein